MCAIHLAVRVRIRVDECPDDLFVWCDLDEHPFPTGADEGIAVEHPLGTTKAGGKEVGRQRKLPGEIIRTIGSSRRKIVFPGVVVYIGADFIDA